jgi:hypothetical protein
MFRLAASWVWDFWIADDGDRYHLFFLKAPRALLDPDRRHWRAVIGHATSTDLTNWTEHADAVIPDDAPAFDDLATWTGSVVRGDDGKWRMFYTAVSRAEGGLEQRISSVVSDDLFTWRREPERQVLEPDARWYETASTRQWPDQAWRDPWVFRDQDGWHMLVTARANRGAPDDRGVIGHATSQDLVHWTVQPPLSEPGAGFGHIEVVQVADVDGTPVGLFSCLGTELAHGRRGADPVGGVWAFPIDSKTGAFGLEEAYRLTDERLYVGRLVQDRKGQWCFLAFRNDEDGNWIGEITDPQPVRWVDDRLAVEGPSEAPPTRKRTSMPTANYYDVTQWPVGDAAEDIGEVINSIIADVKSRQKATDEHDGGKPGAVIYMPPGDYRLRTQVLIDISFLRIEGAGHGFTSSSIRFNVPEDEWPDLHELWPGGSRILVDLPPGDEEAAGAAFHVARSGNPRISSVEFVNFCIDGLHFTSDGSGLHPENTYVNGKSGIYVADANDSFRVNGMGFIYLEHALTVYNADALSVHDNFIAECGSCIELRGWGQASKITDNLIGAGPSGHSIFAEHHGGLLITANNVFPRGASSVRLEGVTRSSVTNNRLHSFYPGMVVLEASSENLIGSNHFLRDHEPWSPFLDIDNGLDDDFGLLTVSGDSNSVIGNHFSAIVDADKIRPAEATPVIIRLKAGEANYVATNHVVALDVRGKSSGSAYAAQVDALLSTDAAERLAVTTVMVDPESKRNTILDSGTEGQVSLDATANAFRALPAVPAQDDRENAPLVEPRR